MMERKKLRHKLIIRAVEKRFPVVKKRVKTDYKRLCFWYMGTGPKKDDCRVINDFIVQYFNYRMNLQLDYGKFMKEWEINKHH